MNRPRRWSKAVVLAGAAALAAAPPGPPLAAESLRDVLGASHAGGLYNFTSEDYLDEGADQLLGLGTRVIRVWLTNDVATLYSFNSDWLPPAANVVELAQKPYFQSLFSKPFTTYLLVVKPVTDYPPFLAGMTAAAVAAESGQMHDLASYLLTTYAGTGKTFVLQNWEGDHLLRTGLTQDQDPAPVTIQGMIDWWNARQDGVDRARAEVGEHGVRVAHAAEVNLLADAMAGKVTATNDVIPYTRADLYSYSSWDVKFDPAMLTQALDYLRSKAPPSALFGSRNIYLGEFGAAKDQVPSGPARREAIDELAEAALAWGVLYAAYWQIYDNEAYVTVDPKKQRPTDAELRGFWLIRPDGIKAAIWPDIQRRLGGAQWQLALRAASGKYLATPRGAAGAVRVSAWNVGPWETLNAIDPSGQQQLRSGARISLQAHGGRYLDVAAGTRALEAGSQQAPSTDHPPARFVLRRVQGNGGVADGDAVTLETLAGEPLVVDFASGEVLAGSAGRNGAPAVFRLQLVAPSGQ
ncbi:MAG TPA: hypothetical protein VMW75_07800 [Thermoanaerobaculia bacterium]|nr:hypothetical protein [Thermoanaerobaculia bacterium]